METQRRLITPIDRGEFHWMAMDRHIRNAADLKTDGTGRVESHLYALSQARVILGLPGEEIDELFEPVARLSPLEKKKVYYELFRETQMIDDTTLRDLLGLPPAGNPLPWEITA